MVQMLACQWSECWPWLGDFWRILAFVCGWYMCFFFESGHFWMPKLGSDYWPRMGLMVVRLLAPEHIYIYIYVNVYLQDLTCNPSLVPTICSFLSFSVIVPPSVLPFIFAQSPSYSTTFLGNWFLIILLFSSNWLLFSLSIFLILPFEQSLFFFSLSLSLFSPYFVYIYIYIYYVCIYIYISLSPLSFHFLFLFYLYLVSFLFILSLSLISFSFLSSLSLSLLCMCIDICIYVSPSICIYTPVSLSLSLYKSVSFFPFPHFSY